MEIDISAAWHKREIAEGFAKLRAKLLPEPEPDQWRAYGLALQNALVGNQYTSLERAQMMASRDWNPYGNALAAAQSQVNMYAMTGLRVWF